MRALRAAPATLPCLAALGLAGWWALDQGGFAVNLWAPGGLAVIGLLVVALVAAPNAWRAVPRAVLTAAVLLSLYALWSFASILWADDPGYALQGASRTLLYAAAFCLFALWPQTERTAELLMVVWIGLVGLAGIILALRLTGGGDTAGLFADNRVKAPTGYPNASAALLLMAVLPAVVLSAAQGVAWWARGACAGLAVLLGALALLTVSRGAVFSMPLVALVLFVLVPGRVRHLFALAPVAAAIALCAPRLLDVSEAIDAEANPAASLHRALELVAIAAVVVALLAAGAALLGSRRPPSPAMAARLRLTGRVVGIAVVLLALAGGLAVAGNPVDRVRSGWKSFQGGYENNTASKNRLISGLGSNRYDFYRVALDTWADHPVAGVGADGFYQQYLRSGRSSETPRYPHSVELRALSQTGLVGAALLLGFAVCALAAALRAMRAPGPVGAAAAGGATIAFAYWSVHGSLDWFWEWPGLGLPAFALIGLACALAPRQEPASPPTTPTGARRLAAIGAGAVLAAAPLVLLWTADHEQRAAVTAFATQPLASFAHLDRAASLDPLSSAPATLQGSIALRYGDLPRADAAFGRALERVPDDQYATLERGAIASARGDRRRALTLLRRAAALAPRDSLTRDALRVVQGGGAVDVGELNRRILAQAKQLAG